MSDTSEGPGWWLASDGKWYAPELWKGPLATAPTTVQTVASGPRAAALGRVPTSPSRPSSYLTQPPAAAPYAAGAYSPQGDGQTPAPSRADPSSGATPTRRTNGLAIASLVCSLAGLLLIPIVLGIVFGFIARSQIKSSRGTQGGEGLALAGIIIGFGWAALLVLGAIVNATTHSNTGALGVFGVLG